MFNKYQSTEIKSFCERVRDIQPSESSLSLSCVIAGMLKARWERAILFPSPGWRFGLLLLPV